MNILSNTTLIKISVLLLSVCHGAYASAALEADDSGNVQINPIIVVEPDPEQREVYEAQIDSEFFEVGFFTGILAIEDFGTDVVTGFKASFHATEDFFLQTNFGKSEAGLTSNEVLTDGGNILINREYSYYNLLVGYNLFPGETFINQNLTLNSAFYLVLGAGNTKFNNDDHFTITMGSGYRIILKDWLTFNLDMRDMSFKTEIVEPKRTHNLEFTAGLTAFF
ncbi:MAG: outer membrane beta-barrel protein [Psychrobacter glaciei]|jgi:outer membrane beta-barrel protein